MIRIGGPAEVTESGLALPIYDYVANAPTSLTDVYTFYQGGSGGTAVAVVTIVYTDASKGTIASVTRSNPGDGAPAVIIHQATVTLNNAQIIDLPNTAVTVIDAPGANLVAILVSGVAILDASHGTYTGTGAWVLVSPGQSFYSSVAQVASHLTAQYTALFGAPYLQNDSGAFGSPFLNMGNYPSSDFIDQPMQIKDEFAGSPYGGGGSGNTLQISVSYLLLNTVTGVFV